MVPTGESYKTSSRNTSNDQEIDSNPKNTGFLVRRHVTQSLDHLKSPEVSRWSQRLFVGAVHNNRTDSAGSYGLLLGHSTVTLVPSIGGVDANSLDECRRNLLPSLCGDANEWTGDGIQIPPTISAVLLTWAVVRT